MNNKNAVTAACFLMILVTLSGCGPAEVEAGKNAAEAAVKQLEWIAGKASPNDLDRKFGRTLEAKLVALLKSGALGKDLTRQVMALLNKVEQLNWQILNLPEVED